MENLINDIQPYLVEDSPWTWLAIGVVSLIVTLIIKLVLKTISHSLRKIAEKTVSKWDDIAVDIIDSFKSPIIYLATFFVLTRSLPQSEPLKNSLMTLVVVCIVIQIAIWGLHVIHNWRKIVLDKKIEADPSSAAALGLLYTGIQIGFIVIVILIGLSNLGIDISALLAGLGVGGIAVALAAQNVLGDLLASLSIVLDKPFVVGDFIVSGEEKGTVEHIGIKTTRLRSISGEQLVFSNKDLLESRVKNFKRMWTRRVVQSFGVTYSTPAETLAKIPGWVKAIVENQEKLKFDRCHFCAYGASSLDFELVFFVSDAEYNVYMDLQEKVLLSLFRKFSEENVNFAFPTQSIHLESVPKAISNVTSST
jgi:small-conductance mechanosensitive channel